MNIHHLTGTGRDSIVHTPACKIVAVRIEKL